MSHTWKCQICLQIGHIGIQCPKRFDTVFIGGPSFVRQLTASRVYPKALSSIPIHGKPPGFSSTKWYIDTGATHHVTPDYDILAEASSYYGPDTVQEEEFVKLLDKGRVPETRHVRGSNYCLMNVFEDRIPGRAIIISVIDNLVKGASGQALQNLNLMMGLPENTGLQHLPLFP